MLGAASSPTAVRSGQEQRRSTEPRRAISPSPALSLRGQDDWQVRASRRTADQPSLGCCVRRSEAPGARASSLRIRSGCFAARAGIQAKQRAALRNFDRRCRVASMEQRPRAPAGHLLREYLTRKAGPAGPPVKISSDASVGVKRQPSLRSSQTSAPDPRASQAARRACGARRARSARQRSGP